MQKKVSILIVSAKGDLLMHHKNRKSSNNSETVVTGFEGDIRPGEAAIGAAVREIGEQTGLDIRGDDLEFLDTYRGADEEGSLAQETAAFVLAGLDEDRIHVYQGLGLYAIHRGDDFSTIGLSDISRKQVIDYFKRHKKR